MRRHCTANVPKRNAPWDFRSRTTPTRNQASKRSQVCPSLPLIYTTNLTYNPRAIDRGANFLAESFLFGVAASLIIAETWRSSNKESKRREGVSDAIEDLKVSQVKMEQSLEKLRVDFQQQMEEERVRYVC